MTDQNKKPTGLMAWLLPPKPAAKVIDRSMSPRLQVKILKKPITRKKPESSIDK